MTQKKELRSNKGNLGVILDIKESKINKKIIVQEEIDIKKQMKNLGLWY